VTFSRTILADTDNHVKEASASLKGQADEKLAGLLSK
jgi:hypothetical protein